MKRKTAVKGVPKMDRRNLTRREEKEIGGQGSTEKM